MNKVQFTLAASLLALVFTFFGCSNVGGGGNTDTYYGEMGGISLQARNLIDSKQPNIIAQEALKYCYSYRVPADKHAYSESGIPRKELEEFLDELAGGGLKASILRGLDKTGAFWGSFVTEDNDEVYIYIEKE